MKIKKKDKKRWSRKHDQIKIGCWNPMSYSFERHDYCKQLQCDILGLTELHNLQAQKRFQSRTWVHSAPATMKEGKSTDPAAGVAIMLSNRMADKLLDEGHVGTRIAWVRIKGPVCNIFYIVVYIPHKGRTSAPYAEDTILQLRKLLRTVRKSECVILAGDFNCQLQRNVPGCTGQWSMTKRPDEGHGELMLDLLRENDLFAVGTLFRPKKKRWGGKNRVCNATYRSKDASKRPRKLDYICVSNRWKSLMLNVEVKWGPSIHRFGKPFDHGFMSAIWRWKTKKKKKTQRSNFAAMDSQSWPEFDTRLRIKLQADNEPPKNKVGYQQTETATTAQALASKDLASEYEKLTTCVQQTIREVVPEQKWLKKNGRVVTQATRDLFDKRAKEYSKQQPTAARRKRWNKIIRNACTNDYRKWVSDWVERIEKADHKGNTKAIYDGVKILSGSKRTISKRPTMRAADPASCETTAEQRTARNSNSEVKASAAKAVTEAKIKASLEATNEISQKNTTSMHEADAARPLRASSGESNQKSVTDPAENKDESKSQERAYAATPPLSKPCPKPDGEEKRPRVRISGPEELAGVWKDFLAAKFTPTELENARAALEKLPNCDDEDETFTREEFDNAVDSMKKAKAPGPDGIPAEVWQKSQVAKDMLHDFLKKVWDTEKVPPNLALCIFIMMYKNKGSPDDCTKYRALGLLNHAYKIMSVMLLRRLVQECASFFSDWQAGFRPQRGCRDNVLLLRVLYDQIINGNSKCVVTYIDFSAAFDTVSHKFMDATLAKAGASRKSRAIFRAIYSAAAGVARVNGTDGKYVYSGSFDIGRGVIQGDIISPVLFILALDALVQQYDEVHGKGFKCGRILRLDVLGYADDVALISANVDDMTRRLTAIANASRDNADMNVSIPKTFTQHVHRRGKLKVTKAEAKAAEMKYKFKCDFCTRRFKTEKNMQIHRNSCIHNYNTTQEVYEVEKVVQAFGHVDNRWLLVKWKDHVAPEWERQHLLERDGCQEAIREFWADSGLNPCKPFYPDPDGKHRCAVCNKVYKRAQDLKTHKTKTGHHQCKTHKVTKTAVEDAILERRKEEQATLPKVMWGEQETTNSWRNKYLGSIFEAGGGCLTDVKIRIATARQRFGKMRHIWADKRLHLNLRLRLYKSSVCSVMTYGAEAWKLDDKVSKALNGANSQMLSVITGRSPHDEASPGTRTFDLPRWIRARRLQWLGHILRMEDDRKLKQAVFEIFKAPSQGDLLMDAPTVKSWRELKQYAADRDYWKARVRSFRQRPVVNVTLGQHLVEGSCAPFTISS